MIRTAAGIVAGLIVWFVVATIGNLVFRAAWPGYVDAEISTVFDLAMMAARLALGALSSLGAGFTAAWITKGNGTAAKALGIVLTALFVPIHYVLWDKFPIWYHALFLVGLFPLTLLGAILFSRRNQRPQMSAASIR